MKNSLLVVTAFAFTALACKNKNGQKFQPDSAVDSSHYFQTAVIIQNDIKELDSVPYYIYQLKTVNGKRDSTSIKTADFKQLAQQFLKPDITTDDMKPQYKESIFEDRTLGGFTINYTAINKELEVQSIDILLKDDGKTVKHIFIKKYKDYGDSAVMEQLAWKPQQQFQVVRSVQQKNGRENNYQTLVVWNDKPKDPQ